MRALIIVLGVLFCLTIVVGVPLRIVIRARILIRLRYHKFIRLFGGEKWDDALELGYKLERKKLLPKLSKQIVKINTALIYLYQGDKETFESKINEVNHKKLLAVKYYWLTVAGFWDKDTAAAKGRYSLFKNAPRDIYENFKTYGFYDKCMTALFEYNGKEFAAADETFKEVMPRMSLPARRIYDAILQNSTQSVKV